MKTQTQFKIAGIIIMLLGIIHVSATPVIFGLFKGNSHSDLASLYMFIMVGVSTFFVGWLQVFALKRITDDSGYGKILEASMVFITGLGIGAVAAMWTNPFAYISLAVAVYEWILFSSLKPGKNAN